MAKWVYMFTEGNATMRNLLGGKGDVYKRQILMRSFLFLRCAE